MRDNGFGRMQVLTLIGSKWRAEVVEILHATELDGKTRYECDIKGNIVSIDVLNKLDYSIKRNQNIYTVYSKLLNWNEMADVIISEKTNELNEIKNGFDLLRVAWYVVE